jgi:alpha-mannosidase
MRDNEWLFRGRYGRFHEELVAPSIYPLRHRLTVTAWRVPDEPVPFDVAVAQEYEPFEIGTAWGRAWSTMWLHVTGQVPREWLDGRSIEIIMDLGFRAQMEGGQAEGLAFRPDGSIIKAIEPFNRYVPVEDAENGVIDFYLEMAANPEVGIGGSWHPSPYSHKGIVPDEPLYVLRQMDVAVRDDTVWELDQDLQVLRELLDELPPDLPRRADIVVGLNRAIDAVDPVDVAGTAADARAVLAPILASPAYASAHRIVATGHAHIDSAWLWPVRETVRKCARTFANVIALMDEHDDMVFSCSSAQQYLWIKQYYPGLWERLKEKVAAGQFVPVGGMWVESDTNMPGSEALARQFVLGKKFFMDELGVEPLEVWLPDSFGYTGALPQVARAAGARWFFTQKMSWSEVNQIPHHTFLWEGIDGTRIFTHFPPVDTYNSRLAGFELAKAERQYKEQGHGTMSIVPFGYGDGGGGPTREMVARARRTADLEGSPKVRLGSPQEFFVEAEAELERPYTWVGEMYLENHRGTYTSQGQTKRGNRRSEHALRAAELWAATAAVRTGLPYPAEELEEIWQTVLLQQFHDILPGSSIAWVHREAEANYGALLERLEAITARSLAALAGEGSTELVVNSSPVELQGVAPFSAVPAPEQPDSPPVSVSGDPESGLVLDNGVLRVSLDADGHIASLVDLRAEREVIPAGRVGGLLQLHNDRPSMYEAWDIDAHIRRRTDDVTTADSVTVVEKGDDAVTVEIVRSFRSSSVVQRMTLARGSDALRLVLDIDWHEQRTLLKLAFPTDVLTDRAASECAFGYHWRTTHTNTSWDMAKHETVAHRWVHVGEPGFGVAVANDSTYGHDIVREQYGDDGPVGTTVRLSLVRGPKFPDPDTDQGRHRLQVSLVVGADIADAVLEGQRLNQPLRRIAGASAVAPLVTADPESVVVESVKLAEDGSGDVVVRLYEPLGRRAATPVGASFGYDRVVRTDLLERETGAADVDETGVVRLALRPFEIVTLRFSGVRRP